MRKKKIKKLPKTLTQIYVNLIKKECKSPLLEACPYSVEDIFGFVQVVLTCNVGQMIFKNTEVNI